MIQNPFKYKIKTWKPKEDIQSTESPYTNKNIPPHLETVFYEALAQYPELHETYIIIVETKFYGIQHTLRSYPPLLSLRKNPADRVYPIVINTSKDTPNSFYDFSYDEQKGILAHELAHILDYTNRTSLQIIGLTFNWFSKKFVKNLEHSTDQTAISRGYSNHLSAYRKRIFEKITRQKSYFESVYLTANEIEGKEKHPTKRKRTYKAAHLVITLFSFIPAMSYMIYLVSIKKMHKKPNWYAK